MQLYFSLRATNKILIPFADLAFVVLAFGVSVSFAVNRPLTSEDVQILRKSAFRAQRIA